jgi:hypothetical protein
MRFPFSFPTKLSVAGPLITTDSVSKSSWVLVTQDLSVSVCSFSISSFERQQSERKNSPRSWNSNLVIFMFVSHLFLKKKVK